jgi:outer membrane protein assembly factor BamA
VTRATYPILVALLWLAAVAHAGADPAPTGLGRWFDPQTAPFIPVPEIDLDPNSGTTVGLIGVWLRTNEQGEVRQILAPDVIYNPYFGYGARARIYAFPSADTQWSVVGGAKQRVEREFAAQYETGRLKTSRWSFLYQAIYDRSGTARFFGIGNDSRPSGESVYTNQQQYLVVQAGWNITAHWQLAYSLTPRSVDVLPGTLSGIPSTDVSYPGLPGLGTTHEVLNRLQLSYDSRDDLVIPTRGAAVVLYGGMASRTGVFNDSLFSEAGADARLYYPSRPGTIWAFHAALRYMPSLHDAPFWALSSIGGDQSDLGGPQPLRGYGLSRFYDRNAFSGSLELRQSIAHFDAVSTHVELQLTPFVDLGQVFAHSSTFPLQNLHAVFGVGVRAVARPFVVGYVDIGKGSEGVVAFSGINYPF